ncbi:Transposase DDE domain protein [Luteitalea pratensis]|uniref:Transposase DDE domain protein n=2 Tax=Luteitalea pratensis TaxID=1855912 RepID=A0A143PMR2_LUTPR|nr:Transposase DDE domain protein [Luteitalea pratensis]
MASMRGDDRQPTSMFSYVSAEDRVPADHPLRPIRALVDEILRDMSRDFDGLYARVGRPSIPPERLLRAQLLQLFYSIRSERLLMEQLDYNILFRWFVGLEMDEPIWVPTVFTKNRDRLLNQEVARQFLQRVVDRASAWMSDEHFTVDGTLIEAWASQKSFQPKDGPPEGDGRNFHGQTRTNDTHASKTDPDARLYRKSFQSEARLAYLGHVLMENRHGLIVDGMATTADGHAERDAALLMLQKHARPSRPRTLGADKLFDTRDFVDVTRQLGYTPHVSQNVKRTGGSAIDRRTTRHAGYSISQACRPRIERVFGWLKPLAGLRKVKLRGLDKVDSLFVFACAAFNLRRLPRLLAMAATPA